MTILANAASPTDAYLAARDKAIAALKQPQGHEWTDADAAREKLAMDGLQPMVRGLVGPLGIKGFPADGASNMDTLSDGIGFGKLDGVTAKSLDGKTTVIVSTAPLLHAWLAGHRNWWTGKSGNPPTDVATAFKTGGFYAQALSNDAHAFKFADIPAAARSKQGVAEAILFMFAQDLPAPNPPDEIAVSVAQDGWVFVFTEGTVVGQIPACKTAYDRDEKAAADVLAAYQAAGAKDAALFKKWSNMGDAANDSFERCFKERVKSQSYYPALVQQAQALVDRVMAH